MPQTRATPAVPSLIETLECRKLLAHQPFGSVDAKGVLSITGTAGNDTLVVGVKGARLRVVLNGVMAQFTASGVQQINALMGDGADVVDLSGVNLRSFINGEVGNDKLIGGPGNDTLTGAAGKDTLIGNAGDDRLSGGNTADIIEGDAGNDVLYGGAADDVMNGNDGRDHLFGEDGNDKLVGGTGNDGIYGGTGDDSISGEAGNDVLDGMDGTDRVYGGVGNDQLTGGPGRDWIYGETGDDVINAADGNADRLVDGGDGSDTVTDDSGLDSPLNIETVNGGVTDPTPPVVTGPVVPVGGALAKAVSFSDEALWENNFQTAAADAKALGVKAVRVWMEVSSYDERPHAYDAENDTDIIHNWSASTSDDDRAVTAGLAMKRAIQLKAMGFTVFLTVSVHGGTPPTSAKQVQDLYTYLEGATLKSNGTGGNLKDAVDAWEVGQEVDLAKNWAPSGVNKSDGLKQYVDDVLIPAASVLHSGSDTSKWEKIISSSVSYSANDMNTIMTEAKAKGWLTAVDYIGYHPYGRYLPGQSINEIADRTTQAVKIAKAFGKPLAATEWNVRGYNANGSQDAAWASAVKTIFDTEIAPNYGIAVYYTLIDNYAGRGGSATATARPAGLFAHNAPVAVTPMSSVSDLQAYYDSPLVKNQPFYDTFASL